MATSSIVRSIYAPVSISNDISIPQFMTKFNPDNAKRDKVVHVDLIRGKQLTYGGLREQAGRARSRNDWVRGMGWSNSLGMKNVHTSARATTCRIL